jgi:polar amino acid transport system substrate-binding protein
MANFINGWRRAVAYGFHSLGIAVLVCMPMAGQVQAQSIEPPSPTIEAPSPTVEPAPEETTDDPVLQVGIGGTPPFVIRQGDNPEGPFYGIVPDVWQQIIRTQVLDYDYVLQTNTQEALDAVASGELDILIGPFSITSRRLEFVDFTQPFFVSSVAVLLPEQSPTIWSRVKPFFTRAALSSVGVLFICLFIVGNAMWLVERKQNPEDFPNDYFHGIGNGMWFALVTLTTVGYGDRSPATPAGRFVASIWMLISLIAVSSLIGGLASAFTLALSQVQGKGIVAPEDLRGARIAVVSGTTGEKWAAEYRARLLRQDNLKDAVTLLLNGDAAGVVFDRPALEYYLAQYPEVDLRLADFNLHSENFGFVLPQNSPLSAPLDKTIVQLEEDGTIDTIAERWLSGVSESPKVQPAD